MIASCTCVVLHNVNESVYQKTYTKVLFCYSIISDCMSWRWSEIWATIERMHRLCFQLIRRWYSSLKVNLSGRYTLFRIFFEDFGGLFNCPQRMSSINIPKRSSRGKIFPNFLGNRLPTTLVILACLLLSHSDANSTPHSSAGSTSAKTDVSEDPQALKQQLCRTVQETSKKYECDKMNLN